MAYQHLGDSRLGNFLVRLGLGLWLVELVGLGYVHSDLCHQMDWRPFFPARHLGW